MVDGIVGARANTLKGVRYATLQLWRGAWTTDHEFGSVYVTINGIVYVLEGDVQVGVCVSRQVDGSARIRRRRASSFW